MSSKLLALSLAAGPLMFGAAIPVDDGLQEQLDQSARTFASSLYHMMNAGRKYNTQAAVAAASVVAGCPGPDCITAGSSETDWSNFALQDRQYFPSLSNARYSVSLAAAVVRLLSNEIAANSISSANTKRNSAPPSANDQSSNIGSRTAFDIVLNSIAWAQRGGDPRLIPSTSNFDRWMPELTSNGHRGGTRNGNGSSNSDNSPSSSSGGSSGDATSSGSPSSVPHWLDDDPVEGTVHPTQHLDVVASNPEPGLLVVVALALAALFLARSLKLRQNM